MPKKDELIHFLQGEHNVGVLLMVQMGGVPEELQLIIQTATYDEKVGGLREKKAYIIRALGVKEHRTTVGIFGSLFFATDHPILYHHKSPLYKVEFKGTPQDPNELVLDIQAAYSATFGPWRDLAEDINREKPLYDLLQSGEGTLGTMPEQAANRMLKVFDHHNMLAHLDKVEDKRGTDPDDDHGEFSTELQLLGIDDSYFIGYSFMVDEMNARKR